MVLAQKEVVVFANQLQMALQRAQLHESGCEGRQSENSERNGDKYETNCSTVLAALQTHPLSGFSVIPERAESTLAAAAALRASCANISE